LALTVPLENRFPLLPLDHLQVQPDGIIVLAGGTGRGIDAVSVLSQDYPNTRLAFSGFMPDQGLIERFAELGGDPARVKIVEPHSRSTFEDALYSAALLKPKPSERWLLVTTAVHMPRAVGCFRLAGFQVQPYPVEFLTSSPSGPFAAFATGSSALFQFD